MIDQSNRAGKTSPVMATDIYTYYHDTINMHNIVPPVPDMSYQYVYPSQHENYLANSYPYGNQ